MHGRFSRQWLHFACGVFLVSAGWAVAVGSVNSEYEAVGDVIAKSRAAQDGIIGKISRCRNYVGTLRDIRIHNRVLTDAEVKEEK